MVIAALITFRLLLLLLSPLLTTVPGCYVFPAETQDPCISRQCRYGARCVPSLDGLSAQCQCPDSCPTFGDHSGSRAVCGSDGVDYPDLCHLNMASCRQSKDIQVKYNGKCDPCAEVTCPGTEVCRLEAPATREPICRCGESCPIEWSPVCASDGKTYANECALKLESCRSGVTLRTVYWGSCDQGVNPCSAVRCAFGESCAIDKSGIARCQCPGGGAVQCPPIIRPVCGTDGRTYDSECELKRTACQQRRDVRLAHPGSCGGKAPCSLNECPHYGICIVRDGKPVCECSIEPCPAEYSPVCGSDGITYGNACKLKAHACQNQAKDLQISYQGQCSGCENRPCEFYAVCETSLNHDPGNHGPSNSGRCVCPDRCAEKMNPVCGSDGTTYKNDCDLKVTACKKREQITVAYVGGCDLCEDVHCLHGAKCKAGNCVCPTNCTVTSYSGTPSELVCASNMQTYASECEMQRASCDRLASNPHYETLTVIFYGDCAEREVAALGNPPTLTTIPPGVIPHLAPGPPPGAVTVRPLNPDENPGYSYFHPRPTINSNTVNHRGTSLLRKVAELNSIMEKKSEAEIEACRDIHCDFSATCEVGPDKMPRCSCKFNCVDIPSSPSSSFELEAMPIGSLSPADRRAYRAGYRPVGSYFYPHQREPTNMRKRRRKRNSKREAVSSWHRGPTIEGRLHREMPTLTVQPVCGSDLKIYPSECALRMEACQRQEELRLRPFQLCQGMEVKPCKGEEPLRDPLSDQELHCGSGPRRQDCPAHSYCHQTQQFAKCCPKEIIPTTCDITTYGCCSDGKTAAMGLDQQGCPTNCGCNRLGSYDDTCDAETGQCHCRPGVGGLKCDRCLPGYWGLPKISEGHQGCMPCACSEYGAVREDCEQMTGRCVCKQGIQGQKCTECIGYRKILGPYGCRDSESNLPSGANCQEITCHFGSVCKEDISIPGSTARAQCTCTMDCVRDRDPIMQVVCGNDGQTYASECELKLNSCRQQKEIGIRSPGPCSDLGYGVTEWPEKRSTALRYTEPEDVSSPQYKSTRHLLVPEIIERPISGLGDPYRLGGNHNRGNGFNDINEVRLTSASLHHTRNSLNDVLYASGIRPTPATVRMVTALVGDLCAEDEDCRQVANAICIRGGCRCRDTFRESHDRTKCLAESEADSHIHHTNEENQNQPHQELNSMEGSCTDEPCLNEGVCREATKLPGHFTCFCHGHWTGVLCETSLIPRAYDIPAFDGRSYVQLKRLHAYSKLSIEIEFKTYAKDGILLYNEQREDGMGDFVSLAVINGFVEFRYNLGNGPVIIRSTERVEPKRFHRVIAKRYHRDGMLKLDDSEDIAGQSQGSLKSLDLMLDAFVGYVPTNYSRVYENIGTSHGLMGCIRRLRVGRHTVDLHEGLDLMVERARGIRECGENPCSSLPCQHGGQCEPIRADTFRCTCTPQYTGTVCESRLDPCLSSPCVHGATCESLPHGTYVCKCPPGRKGNRCHELDAELQESFVAQFDVDSWMELPKLEHVGRAFSIELWLKLDGIVNNNLINSENESSSDTREICILYSGPLRGGGGFPVTTPLGPEQQHSTTALSTTTSTSATPTVMFMAMLADDHQVLSTTSQAQQSDPYVSSTPSPPQPPPPPLPPKPTGGDFISLIIDTNGVLRFAFDLGSGPANISWPHQLPVDRWISIKLTRLNQEGSLLVLDGLDPAPEPVHGRSQPPLNELNLEQPLYLGKPPHRSNWSGFRGALQRLIINGHSVRGLSANYLPPPVSTSVTSAVFSQRFSIEQYSGHPCPIDDNSPCLNGGVCVPMLEKYVCQCPLRFNGTHCQHLVDYISSTIPIKFTGDTFYQYPNKIRKSSGLTNHTNINATNDSTTTSLAGLESMNLDEIADDNGEQYDEIDDDDEEEEEEEEEDDEEELDDFLEEEDIIEITQDDMDFLDGRKGERTNRYELRMRTHEPNGLILWRSRGRSLQQDYLSLAIVNGFVEASLNLGRQEELLLVRSKVYIADGQWHEVLVSRVKRQLWLKVDAEQPVRGLAARGATLLKTNKRLWIGGAPTLPSGLPAAYYMGYKGCLDGVRVGRKSLDLIQHRISTGGSIAVQYCHENAV